MVKTLIRWLILSVMGLVTLVALAYAIENWRGQKAWQIHRREREAQGDLFVWSAITPPAVPDERKLAAAPVFAVLYVTSATNRLLASLKLPPLAGRSGNWRIGTAEHLAEWRRSFTNQDLLAALDTRGTALREMEVALQRPECTFPICYEDNFAALLPHLDVMLQAARVLRLRALAELEIGQVDSALRDVQTCVRMADCIRGEPLLLSCLVRVAVLDGSIQVVWEGLLTHRWREEHLAALQALMGGQTLLDQLFLAYQGERMTAYSATQTMLHDPRQILEWLNSGCGIGGDRSVGGLLVSAVPRGWICQNELAIDRWFTERLIPAVHVRERWVDARAITEANATISAQTPSTYNILAKLLVPASVKSSIKVALCETGLNEAGVACAIERYRLASGHLPERLDALVPNHLAKLPDDVMDGLPLRYKTTGDGKFVLYSIGWNGTDDGGEAVFEDGSASKLDTVRGDWIWRSAP